MRENEVSDETCSIYLARGWTNGAPCTDFVKCGDCVEHKGCWDQKTYSRYQVEEYGSVQGELNMMNEIYQRGPITCSLAATKEFAEYQGGIFEDRTGAKVIGFNDAFHAP